MKKKLSYISKFLDQDIVAFILCIVIGIAISVTYRFENNWDFANYHYYNAWAFLHNRLEYDIVPASVNTFFNPLIDLPLYFEIQYFNDSPAVIFALQGIWAGLLLFMLYKIAKLFFDAQKIENIFFLFFALIIGITGQATFFQIGSCTNEIQVSFLILWGLYYLFKMMQNQNLQRNSLFLISGIIMGAALGFKSTCITYCVAAGGMLFMCYPYLKKPIKYIFLFALGGLCGYLLVNGWWMWRLWHLFDNPFFPFANGIFHSPWFDDFNYSDQRFLPPLSIFSVYPYLWYFAPYRISEISFSDIRLPLYYTLFWGSAIYLLLKSQVTYVYHKFKLETAFFIFLVLSFMLWMSGFSILRYAVVIESLGAVLWILLFKNVYKMKNTLLRLVFISIMSIISGILISTCISGDKWDDKLSSQSYIEIETIKLPENTLLKLYNFPTAFVIPEFEKYSQIRAIGYMHKNCTLMKGSDFVERGLFRQKREEIVKNHNGPTIIIYYDMDGAVSLEEHEYFTKKCQEAQKSLKNPLQLYCGSRCPTWPELEEALREEMKDQYFCRILKNNIKTLHICVPKELKTTILGEEND